LTTQRNLNELFVLPTARSYQTDLRLAEGYYKLKQVKKIFDTHKKNSLRFYYQKKKTRSILIRPREKLLVSSIEQLRMPDDMIGLVSLRSSYARLGLQASVCFVDPGFIGQLTFEISGGDFPVLLHMGDRMFHAIFVHLRGKSEKLYQGRYQKQKGVTLPIFP
jgi:dCTP deaminase